jgi:4-amino-4-deoxy-L-arabinose transferase-like glycosyltransferase
MDNCRDLDPYRRKLDICTICIASICCWSGNCVIPLAQGTQGGVFAFGVSMLTMLNPQVFFWRTHITTEGLSLFFLTLSLYFMKCEKSSHWLLGGISVGLTFAARYTISLQAIAIFVAESITRRNPKFVIKTLMTMLPMIALVVMIVYFKTGTF